MKNFVTALGSLEGHHLNKVVAFFCVYTYLSLSDLHFVTICLRMF